MFDLWLRRKEAFAQAPFEGPWDGDSQNRVFVDVSGC
jgi:hypothetical protein